MLKVKKHFFRKIVLLSFISITFLGAFLIWTKSTEAQVMPTTVTLNANGMPNAITVMSGMPVSLTWTSMNATSCTGSWTNPINGSVALQNTAGTPVTPTAPSTTYTITCGSVSSSVMVTVTQMLPNVTLNANGMPNAITVMSGMPVSLTWTSMNATSCTGSWTNPINGSVALQNTAGTPVTPTAPSTTYTITCGSVSSSVMVTVTQVAPGTLTIYKIANGATGIFKFNISGGLNQNNIPISTTLPNTTTSTSSGHSNPISLTGSTSNTYNITENTTDSSFSGWKLMSASCADANGNIIPTSTIMNGVSVTIQPGQSANCSFTNKNTTIEIVKNGTGGPGQQYFSFNISGPGISNPSPSITTGSPDPAGTTTGSTGKMPLTITTTGQYTITENPQNGWQLTTASCNGVFADPNGILNIYISPGDTVACAFYNAAVRTKLMIRKVTDQEINGVVAQYNGASNWSFTVTPVGATRPLQTVKVGVLADTGEGEKEADQINLGQKYSIKEINQPPDFAFLGVSCEDSYGNVVGDPDLANLRINNVVVNAPHIEGAGTQLNAGGTVTCTFKNRKQGKLTIYKNANDKGTFTVNYDVTGKLDGLNDVVGNPDEAVKLTTAKPPGSTIFTTNTKVYLFWGMFDITEKNADNLGSGWTFCGAWCGESAVNPAPSSFTKNLPLTVTIGPSSDEKCIFANVKSITCKAAGF